MSEAENEKDAEISSLKNLNEEENQIVARIWEFLGSLSFEELKGRTLCDRCALLDELLSECMRHRYYDENACFSVLAGGSEKGDFGIRAYFGTGTHF